MIEFENVKEALTYLNTQIETRANGGAVTVQTVGKDDRRLETIQDFAESLEDTLANICDLLGMSEIYLDD